MEHLHIDVLGHSFSLCRPADLETLWDQLSAEDQDQDERIPYWVEVWPAAILLAKWVLSHAGQLKGKTCLDLGCGLGLCSQAMATCQARVVGVDYEQVALEYALHSAKSAQNVLWMGMDWRKPCFKPGSFPLILGADILYESRFFSPLLALWQEALAPGGRIWLSTPDRAVSRSFLSTTLPQAGWMARCLCHEPVSHASFQHMEIMLWEITRGY